MRPASLIWNPASGGGRRRAPVFELVRSLAERGFAVEALATTAPGHATELARSAAEVGSEVIFVLGGDGTIREAAAGLLDLGTALAPLPGGTTNVVACHLGLPSRPLAAAARYDGTASTLRTRRMDVGRCGSLPFLIASSLGLDARTMLAVDAAAKRRWGRLAVIEEGFRQLRRFAPARFRVRFGDDECQGSLVALCNIAEYAGPFRLAPGADPADGLLDLVVFRGATRRATFGLAGALVAGRHLRRRDVEVHRVREAVIDGPSPAAVQVDGDGLQLELPLRIVCERRRLTLLEPTAQGPTR